MQIVGYILVALGAYLLGSIPTGYLVARARGVDIRTVGSKNMGATNVFRVLGKGPGIFVLLADALKGFVASAWLADALLQLFHLANPDPIANHLIAGIGAILGHNYTCWLGFKGGKGIATTAGVFLALAPSGLGIALLVWIIFFAATRYVSVASILAAAALPIGTWFTTHDKLLTSVTAVLGALAIYKHKSNIQRLMNGTESRLELKKSEGKP